MRTRGCVDVRKRSVDKEDNEACRCEDKGVCRCENKGVCRCENKGSVDVITSGSVDVRKGGLNVRTRGLYKGQGVSV